ncbi:L,D-transpeptidase family protein [uncultured Thiodictyon sp.]|uniref:L,D-transpeptidase family protein n=1 Tax=uncultured Thiodictyon sp. TaxID=1846217 RepID=UPI0025FA239A|nr:L,D-transpeptidase family protein [uncultured Thiodictyon sp.]
MNKFARLLLLLAAVSVPFGAHAFSLPWLSAAPQPAARAPASVATPTPGNPQLADRIVVKKAQRRLYLMRGNTPWRTYKIALGLQPTGHKRHQGDGRTPEGRYRIDRRVDRSGYHKALQISYPSPTDRLRAQVQGVDPGGLIMIHGQPNGAAQQRAGDWTFGCIAVSNLEIDEIWSLTAAGTPVEILP